MSQSNIEDQSEAEWPSAPPPVSLSPTAIDSPTSLSMVSMTTGAELIELVRKNTSLSYEMSRIAVGVVVGHLQATIPGAASDLEQVLLSLVESKVSIQRLSPHISLYYSFFFTSFVVHLVMFCPVIYYRFRT